MIKGNSMTKSERDSLAKLVIQRGLRLQNTPLELSPRRTSISRNAAVSLASRSASVRALTITGAAEARMPLTTDGPSYAEQRRRNWRLA